MSPTIIDPNIDYRRLQELSGELFQFWQKIHALYLDAVAGFEFIRSRVDGHRAQLINFGKNDQDDIESLVNSSTFSYSQIFSKEFCASGIHRSTHKEAIERNSPGGYNYITLGRLCLIALADYWNDYLRKEYSIAIGALTKSENDGNKIKQILAKHARDDFWGDLCKLRNSIVHGQGVAGSDISRCKVIKWFVPGENISINPEQMYRILMGVLQFRNDLHKKGIPKLYIRVPG